MKRTNPAGFQTPHSHMNRLARLLWGIVWLFLFRPTPLFMAKWRTWLLKCFGAKIKKASFHPTAKVWQPWALEIDEDVWVDRNVNLYNAFGIKIGSRVVISQNTFLCTATHDYTIDIYPLTGGKIVIEDDCWITANVFVAPGVTVHEGSVVGACAVVTRDVPPWTVVAGNPAKVIKERKVQ